MPTADFPGIGASIRISTAAKLIFKSSCKPIIRLTFVPFAGSNSYRVTVGPWVAFTTFAVIPKLSNVSSSKTAL